MRHNISSVPVSGIRSEHRRLLVHRQRDPPGGEVRPQSREEERTSVFNQSTNLQQLTVKTAFGAHCITLQMNLSLLHSTVLSTLSLTSLIKWLSNNRRGGDAAVRLEIYFYSN